jgi:hypothetical protein
MSKRLKRTVLVLFGPLVLLLLAGSVTGSTDLGSPELDVLYPFWLIGLTYIWWPRR